MSSAAAGMKECDDATLMKQIQDGRVDAFEQLYDRYCARAYRVARSVCRDEGRAEEAVQAAFVEVWRKTSSYRHARGSVPAWLMAVTRTRAIELTRRSRVHLDRPVDPYPSELHRSATEMPAQAGAREEEGRVRARLEELPDSQLEVIVLAYFGQLTHTEIATHLELSPGAVKGRMRLGLQKLKTQVGRGSCPLEEPASPG